MKNFFAKKAASFVFSDSFLKVGCFYSYGIGTKSDKHEAFKYFEKGYEEGSTKSACEIADILISGDEQSGDEQYK